MTLNPTPDLDLSSSSVSHFSLAHQMEENICRELRAKEDWTFHSLVVHRMHGGICLQGVVECDDSEVIEQINAIARRIAKVDSVMSQIVVQKSVPTILPKKG